MLSVVEPEDYGELLEILIPLANDIVHRLFLGRSTHFKFGGVFNFSKMIRILTILYKKTF